MCKTNGNNQGQTNQQRRKFLVSASLATFGIILDKSVLATDIPKPENLISSDKALERLMAGNERYVTGASTLHDFVSEREALVGGQTPYAAILSCSDSRIAPEYAFDSSRGELFVVRVAGNFVSNNGLASLEYAATYLGTKLFMILGHQSCGAISSAIKSIQTGKKLPGNMPALVEAISPAVGLAIDQSGQLLTNAIRENVRLNVAALKAASPILSLLVARNEINIIGGVYRLMARL
jgi:carbonic anhydrase